MKIIARLKWAVLCAFVGIGFEVWLVVSFASLFKDTGTSFIAPGEITIPVSRPGDFTLWHESKTVINGEFMNFPDFLPSGTTIRIIDQSNGALTPLRPSTSGASTEFGASRRVAVGEVKFAAPGRYRFIVTGLQEKRALYLEETKDLKILMTGLFAGFAGMIFLFASIGLTVYALVRPQRPSA